MCCQTPPRITLAAFWLFTPKHPHLRKFIHTIFPCLEHSSQSLQILLALSVRITSRVDFLKHIHPVSPVFYFILSTYGNIWSHHVMTNGRGNNGNSDRLFSWAPKITVDSDCSHKNKRCLFLERQAMTNLNSMLESRDIPLPTKLCIVKAMVFPIVLYGCENWAKEKAEDQRIYAFKLVLKKNLESPLDSKEIKQVNPKGNQWWIFIGTDAETEASILWPTDAKNWLTGKDLEAGKNWISSVSSVACSCPTLCNPMNCSMPGSLSINNSWSLFKLTFIELVMLSNHLILCHPLLLLPLIFPNIRVFSNESILHIRWPKYWSFTFNINPYNKYSGLISFRMDWLDLLVVQRTLKSPLQHHSSKVSILQCSAFFIVQLSHPYMTTEKTIVWLDKDPCCQSNVSAF